MVGTEVFRYTAGGDGCVEHPTEIHTVHIAGMDTESDDTARKLIHDYKNPVALQQNGFTPKQVDAPEAVPGVPEEGQP